MAKFKVGDKVKILDGSMFSNYAGGWTYGMCSYIGHVATIERVNRLGEYFMKEIPYVWDERGLELVKEETIVVYRKDQKVIALDKSTGKKAIARCNPADTFDFETGAKLALNRLFGTGVLPEQVGPFKVGDIVKGNKDSNMMYACTNEHMIGKVIDIYHDYIRVKILDQSDNPYYVGKEFDVNPKYFERVEFKEVHRTAKAGEFVKIVAAENVPLNDDATLAYKNGDIIKIINNDDVFKRARFREGTDKNGASYILLDREYIVLEGIKQEEPKPQLYNGKIIFTKGDACFKTGHIYEVKNGLIESPINVGSIFPKSEPLKDIDDVKDFFAGRCRRKRIHGWSNKTLELIEVADD